MKEIISTEHAPRAIGPYSQAIKTHGFIFTAGQVGIDPATGALVPGTSADQARQALENLRRVLNAAGSSFDQVIKTTVFLTDIEDYALFNAVYGDFFTTDFPARSAVVVKELPAGASVEIEMIALATRD